MRIAIIIPTVKGREADAWRCAETYRARTPWIELDIDVLVDHERQGCGVGWAKGIERSSSCADFIHLTADDLEPHHGWAEAAVASFRCGTVPGARILRPDGSLESCAAWETDGNDGEPADLARIPFASATLMREIGMIPIQYYSDNFFHDEAAKRGYPCVINQSYRFTHYRPRNLRPGEQERMLSDQAAYETFKRAIEGG